LSEEINRLRSENEDLEAQAKEVRLRLSEESALQKRVGEQLALMVVLFAEIESLRRRVGEKEREVEEVRRRSLSPNIL
jgi:chromosome segregation ATPase